jgi:glucuronoarabinoxylan endo-1,4-beta-xylanase
MKQRGSIAGGLVLSLLAAAGCGASGQSDLPPDNTTMVPFNVNVTVDPDTHYQTMVGFGAAVAFEVGLLSNQPNRADIYNALFVDGGFQMLRIANWYQNSQAGDPNHTGQAANPNDMGDFNATVSVVADVRAALGHDPVILLSSWSPPPSMKSVNKYLGGTLGQSNGAYRYADFGQWWRASLDAYAAAGVVPTYVSIQNEPDFVPAGGNSTWSACLLDPAEDLTKNAGYGPALAAVSDAISDLSPKPALIGPEVSGIGSSRVENYLQAMATEGTLDRLDGVAHHLYNGGASSAPSTFNFAMSSVSSDSGGKPLFQTEFGPSPASMFDTAWLISTAVTVEGVTAYLHWDLIWGESASSPSPSGLISIETAPQARWQTPKGFKINDSYYAVRHFAKWIDVGWQRIGATPGAAVIHAAAFASPDGQNATIVLLNSDSAEHTVTLDTGAFAYGTSMIYRTSGTDERTAPLGALPAGNVIDMPARSIVTLTLTP